MKRKPAERRAQVIAALLTSPSIASAARRAGVGERTVRGWLKDPEFSDELAKRRSDALGQGVTRLAEVFGRSVERLHRIATSKATRQDVAAAAARAIITNALRASETQLILDRLDALERLLTAGPDLAGNGRKTGGSGAQKAALVAAQGRCSHGFP